MPQSTHSPHPVAASPSAVPVKSARVALQTHAETLRLVGSLSSDSTFTVRGKTAGPVVAVNADVGDAVARGSAVIRLGTANVQQQIRVQEAALMQALSQLGATSPTQPLPPATSVPDVMKARVVRDNAKSVLDRYLGLQKEGFVGAKDLADARAAYLGAVQDYRAALEKVDGLVATVSEARATLRQIRAQLDDCVLTSPVSGFVQERKVSPGDWLQAGEVALVLVRTEPLLLEVDVPERHLAHLALGQKVTVTSDATMRRVIHGTVWRISPTVDPVSRSIRIRARLEAAGAVLRPGVLARVLLYTGRKSRRLLVPGAAVGSEGGSPCVFVLDGAGPVARVRRVTVSPGATVGPWTVVSGRVRPQESVVASNPASLSDGAAVLIEQADAVAAPAATW